MPRSPRFASVERVSDRRVRHGRSLPRLAAVATLLLAACAGDGPPVGSDAGGLFSHIQSQIFDRRCTAAACHAAANRAGGLSLARGESYDEIVGVLPENDAARSRGLLRIAPEDPEGSFLLQKLLARLEPGEGSPMPLGAAPLAPEEVALIADWIAAGAPPDSETAAAAAEEDPP